MASREHMHMPLLNGLLTCVLGHRDCRGGARGARAGRESLLQLAAAPPNARHLGQCTASRRVTGPGPRKIAEAGAGRGGHVEVDVGALGELRERRATSLLEVARGWDI